MSRTLTAALPDINAETYPFGYVQQLVDQAAYLNLASRPACGAGGAAIRAGGEVVGVRAQERLHRFAVSLRPPRPGEPPATSSSVGEAVGRFDHRWLFAPESFAALPGREPPAVPFDPAASQRFVMLDGVCRLGERDGFRGFGTGRTFPMEVGGRREVWAGAIGTITEGFGRFAGHAGTYTYCGSLEPDCGFTGNLLCRVLDPQGDLRTLNTLPALRREPAADEPGVSYLLLRGRKRGRAQATRYRLAPGGGLEGFDVEQELRRVQLDFALGSGGVRCTESVGEVVGRMTSSVSLNLLDPGAPGTELSPIPFAAFNSYFLDDAAGGELGSFAADGSEGRTFNAALPGAEGLRALRFAGFGPIVSGTGVFAGARGLLMDNSLTGISPHVLSTLYVARLADPEGRFRT